MRNNTLLNSVISLAIALLALPTSAQDISQPAWHPSPTTDDRGYIDVWRLRDDVAYVESMFSDGETEFCSFGGEDEKPPSAREIKRRQKKEDECVKKIERDYEKYQGAFNTLNVAWLPVMYDAIKKGDPVAEVILRLCETTQVLDRSGIETTCDEDDQRRSVANEHIDKIGFLPATNNPSKDVNWREPQPVPHQWEINQLATLKKVRGGALAFPHNLVNINGFDDHRYDFDVYRRWYLLDAVHQDAPRAFTASSSHFHEGLNANYAELRLVRYPSTPGRLTYGKRLYEGESNLRWKDFWRWEYKDYIPNPAHTYSPNIAAALAETHPFFKALATLQAEMESTIDQYLAIEPRWAVFLLNRVSNHEWVPEGTISTTQKIDPSWLGTWILEKESVDWERSMKESKGTATITSDGEYTRIVINAETEVEPFLNVSNCLLRYSGGATFLPKFHKNGSLDSSNTILGNYRSAGPNEQSVAPFNPKKRYKQVLMQCKKAEDLDSMHVRFLFLAKDTLVEFADSGQLNDHLGVRHYSRLKAVSEPN